MVVSGRMFLCTNCELCIKRTELVNCLARSKRQLSGYLGLLSISRARRDFGEDREVGMAKRNLNVGGSSLCAWWTHELGFSVHVVVEDLNTPVQVKRPKVEGSTFDRMRANLRTSRTVRFISAMGLQIMVSTSICCFESGSWQRRAEENGIWVSSVVRTVAGLKMLPLWLRHEHLSQPLWIWSAWAFFALDPAVRQWASLQCASSASRKNQIDVASSPDHL